jgi:hypothetical protein
VESIQQNLTNNPHSISLFILLHELSVKTKVAHALQYRQRRTKGEDPSTPVITVEVPIQSQRGQEMSAHDKKLHKVLNGKSFMKVNGGKEDPAALVGSIADANSTSDYVITNKIRSVASSNVSEEYKLAYEKMMLNPSLVAQVKAAAAAAANHRSGTKSYGEGKHVGGSGAVPSNVISPSLAPKKMVQYQSVVARSEETLRRLSGASGETLPPSWVARFGPPPSAYSQPETLQHDRVTAAAKRRGDGIYASNTLQMTDADSKRQNPYEKMFSLLQLASTELSNDTEKDDHVEQELPSGPKHSAPLSRSQPELFGSKRKLPASSSARFSDDFRTSPSSRYAATPVDSQPLKKKYRRPSTPPGHLPRLEGLDSVINEVLGRYD